MTISELIYPGNQITFEGTVSSISCFTEANVPTWTKDYNSVEFSMQHTSFLLIPYATLQDMGKYTCTDSQKRTSKEISAQFGVGGTNSVMPSTIIYVIKKLLKHYLLISPTDFNAHYKYFLNISLSSLCFIFNN